MLFKLFFSFFKIGLFTFGGRYAMLPLMRAELVEKHQWITDDELLDYFSVSQCTPGVIAVNVSTFVGHKTGGVFGAVTATSAVVLPSLIIILSIASVLTKYMSNPYVSQAFNGIRAVVLALILNILAGLWKKGVKTKTGFALFAGVLALSLFAKFSPVMIVGCILVFSLSTRKFRGAP